MTKIIQAILVLTSLVLFTACDKERPYDEIENKVANDDVQTKGVVDHISADGTKFSLNTSDEIPLDKQYLAVVSTTSIDKDAPITPYEMGRQVRTVLSFTRDHLIAYEVPDQYTGEELNFKPFIKIPITHIDYKCQEDANGKCTQKEVVDTEKTWINKRFFSPSFKDTKLESLDGLFSSLINYAFSCSTELESKVIAYKFEKDALNITLEKTKQQSFACSGLTVLFNPSAVTYRVQENISIVKLSSLASSDYDPLEYQLAGPNEFGYFKTIYTTRDAANRLCLDCQKQFVSRWNPKNKVIKYHLSANFDKPENATLKAATYHGIEVINEAFAEAGTDMKIELRDSEPGDIEGDIRKNLIVMVEDPISRGLLGYGPSVTNPMTGEIVHARTVMFPGIMRMTIEQAYGEFQELIAQQEQDKINRAQGMVGAVVGLPEMDSEQQSKVSQALIAMPSADRVKTLIADQSVLHKNNGSVINRVIGPPSHSHLDDTQVKLLKKYYEINENKSIELREEMEELTRHNYYPAELFNINGAMGEKIKMLVIKNDYRPWGQLTSDEQEVVINTLLPIVWVPTFVHEIGHNLGLRHNFHGSNDRDNYYTSEELKEKGIDREMKYSSIMDYAYSSANELSVMGKYDVAALRFAYAEKMETVTGDMVSIKERVAPGTIKPFMFCTDDNVSLMADCNQFDEGANYTEVVQNIINDYESNYRQRNLKGNRYSFTSTNGDVGQISRLSRSMGILRSVFEVYEEVTTANKEILEADPTQWETNDFLKDLKSATLLSGQFLINIIETPDVHCLIAQQTPEGLELAAIVQLQSLSSRDSSCFGVDLATGFLAVGQAGRSYNHIRDKRNPLAGIDQIDVRGIWIDKMLALETLLQRATGLGNFDNKVKNMLSVPELKEPIMNMLTKITSDKFDGVLTFDTILGEPMTIPWSYSLFRDDTHLLNQHFHPGVVRRFSLRSSGPTIFQRSVINTVKKYDYHEKDRVLGQEIYDTFSVRTFLPNGEEEKDIETYRIGNDTIYAYPSNLVARQTLVSLGALDQVNEINAAIAQDPTKEEQVKAVVDARKEGVPVDPSELTDEFTKLLYTVDLGVLEDSLNGQLLPREDFYEMILYSLNN